MGVMTSALSPRPAGLIPSAWTFWADAIVGGARFGPVDVSAFTCTSKLSDFGSGSVTLSLPSGLPPGRELALWSWRLWAMYEGRPYWCGVPTGITDEGTASVALTLTELTGYLARRLPDWSPSKVYTQVEQTVIAADLAAPLADVGVPVVTSAGSGQLRDRTYEFLQGTRASLLTDLSQVINGPEFRAEYAMTTGGLPQCTLRVAYPRVGSGQAGLGLNVNVAALGYRADWDSDQLRTRTYAVGDTADNAPAGTPQPVAITDAPQASLPRLDAADDWPGTVVQSTLREKAAAASLQYAAPTLALTVTPSEAVPDLQQYRVGDDVTVRVTTPLMPGGLTVTGRLLQIDLDAGAGTAAWTVGVTQPPPQARETIARRLSRLDRTVRAVFRGGPKTVLP